MQIGKETRPPLPSVEATLTHDCGSITRTTTVACCLCFDFDVLVQRLTQQLDQYGQLHHGPVIYENRQIAPEALITLIDKLRVDGPIEAGSGHLGENIRELLFTKLEDWRTETEYRFVVQTEEQDAVYATVTPALRAVILGADEGSSFYEPAFAKFCDPAGVEILHMRWNHGFPHLAPRFEPRSPSLS
jgi:hypothetical protein